MLHRTGRRSTRFAPWTGRLALNWAPSGVLAAAALLLMVALTGPRTAQAAADDTAKPAAGPSAPSKAASPSLLGGFGNLSKAPPGLSEDGGGDEEAFYGDSRDRVTATAELGRSEVLAGGDLPAIVVLSMAPHWHIWPDARPFTGEASALAVFDGAIRTELKVKSASPGVKVHTSLIQWPKVVGAPADLGDGLMNYGVFEGRSVVSIPITIDRDAPPGKASVVFETTFQTCNDRECMGPAVVELPLSFTIVAPGAAIASQPLGADFANFPSDVFARIRAGDSGPSLVQFRLFRWTFTLDAASQTGFLLLLLAAAGGGLLLNFTPCVLPVIPLKIMGLSSAAGSRRRCLTLGMAMALGVVAFWTGLGLAMATVSGFTSTSQLFTNPLITIAIGLFIALMAIGMCGLFSLSLPQWVYGINPQHDSHTGSFFFGVMTAVLSTPCTAPLMGAAAAWAATQVPSTTMLVFAVIGLGMAIPYLVLAAFPHLVARMPRTGPASELIKQVMGLLLLAAAAYFVGAGLSGLLVTAPDPPNRLYWWAVALFGMLAGLWLAWRTLRITPSFPRRAIFGGTGLAIAVVSFLVGRGGTADGPIKWTYYTPDRFAEALKSGNAVLLDFTAEWCANCKTLEHFVLNSDSVAGRLGPQHGIVPIKVDITGNNPDGIAKRDSLGFRSIPLLVVFAPDGSVIFKSEAYTPAQVVEAIEAATKAATKTATKTATQSAIKGASRVAVGEVAGSKPG